MPQRSITSGDSGTELFKLKRYRFYIYYFIILLTEADLFGIIEQMSGMATFHAFNQVLLARFGVVVNHIDAGTVESHGVKTCQDANVADFGRLGSISTVAVNREVVGH